VGEYFADKLGGPVGSGIVEELVGLSRFDKLTTLSQVEGQIPMTQFQNSKQMIRLLFCSMASLPSDRDSPNDAVQL
jgi:hypothetical protein